MSLLDNLKNKVDQSEDGRLSKDDLEAMKDGEGDNDSWIDKLKEKADQNEDGKIGKDDLSGLSSSLGGMKDKLFGS